MDTAETANTIEPTPSDYTPLTQLPAWQALQRHFREIAPRHMRDMFAEDPERFSRYSLKVGDILLDYSKNRIDDTTMKLLMQLAHETDVEGWRERMFSGDKINFTEQRSVLHVALRNRGNRPIYVDGEDVMPEVNAELGHMRRFTEQVRSGEWRGHTGRPIKDVVNLGVGGSDLGPLMVCEALKPFGLNAPRMHFVSNVAPSHIAEVLREVDPETTLFIVSSKSFTTQETMINARTARSWFLMHGGGIEGIRQHFVAVSTSTDKVVEFGISPDNMFRFWDWVGGRYSLWSSIGLSIALYIGMDRFEDLLAGAYLMDEHFRTAPLERNMPVIMAMLGVWYNNFFGAQSHAVFPYGNYLRRLPMYLQQADMESNGKTVDRAGQRVDYSTGHILWGGPGTNVQHSFFQLIHQGSHIIPGDFIGAANSHSPIDHHHEMLLANMFAQSQAFMQGRSETEVRQEMEAQGVPEEEVERLLPHKICEGNKPSNTILYRRLTPKALGSLLALYEHKIFVQGIIWGLDSYDQWGVELGKKLANDILPTITNCCDVEQFDSSTNGLINHVKQLFE